MTDAESRAETARQLRAEAHALLTESGLFGLLEARFGEAAVTGSAGYDLMTRRQIDIHMPVDPERQLEWAAFPADIARALAANGFELLAATYRNDYAEPGPMGAGLFLGVGFRAADGAFWQIDLWGWDPFDHAVRQARDFSLRTDLKACNRDLILRLKTEALARGDGAVASYDIYRFVIAQAGDDVDACAAWVAGA
jgi:hypothetical protein